MRVDGPSERRSTVYGADGRGCASVNIITREDYKSNRARRWHDSITAHRTGTRRRGDRRRTLSLRSWDTGAWSRLHRRRRRQARSPRVLGASADDRPTATARSGPPFNNAVREPDFSLRGSEARQRAPAWRPEGYTREEGSTGQTASQTTGLTPAWDDGASIRRPCPLSADTHSSGRASGCFGRPYR
jgi:hypothetical protein